MNHKLYYNISFLRIFAIISVVLGHTLMYDSPIMFNIYKVVFSYHIPLFVFISGFLFMDSQSRKNNNFFSVVINKFKRLVVPILFVSLFWIIPSHLFISRDLIFSLSDIMIKVKDLLSGNVEYLWFLLMLFWVIIFFYPINILLRSKNSNIFVLLTGIILIWIFLKTSIPAMINFYSIAQASKYLYYFYLGAVFYKYKDQIDPFIRNNKTIVMIVSIFLVLNSQMYIIINYETYIGAWFISSHIGSYFVVSTIMIMVLYMISVCYKDQIENIFKNSKIMTFLDKESFGIYFVHIQIGMIIIQLIAHVKIPLTQFNKISTLFFSMVLLSSVLILIYNKIKGYLIKGKRQRIDV